MKNKFDFLVTTFIRFYFFILKKLPPKLKLKFALALTKIIIFFFPRSKYVCFRNLSICFPDLSKEEKNRIWKGSIETLAKNLIGFSTGPSITRAKAYEMLDFSQCEDIIEELQNNNGTGALLLVPHFGQFELLGQLWAAYDKPFAILARGFGMKHLDSWWNKQRQANGNIIFSRKGGFKDLLTYLESGKNVGILFDQNVKRSHSMFVNFFGTPASTTKTIGLASLKTSCKIFFTTMVETSEGKFKIIAHRVTSPDLREGDIDAKIHDTILESHKHLEELIKEYPEQWFWIHRRFKTRPSGELEDLYEKSKYPENL